MSGRGLSRAGQRGVRRNEALNRAGQAVRHRELGRWQIADEQLGAGWHRAGVEGKDGVSVAVRARYHDLSDASSDATRVEVPVIIGSLTELAHFDEHREPCLTKRGLQPGGVIEVALLRPGHLHRAV